MRNFAHDQLKAAQAFAQTMIIVDDDVGVKPQEVVTKTVSPTRGTVSRTEKRQKSGSKSHTLNAKKIVDNALGHGLVCSVVKPKQGEQGVAKRVAQAAMRADIVSVDWEMNGDDDGKLAAEIISEILQDDFDLGGRLRLISIYTGSKSGDTVLSKLLQKLPEKVVFDSKIRKFDGELVSDFGLKLVFLQKGEFIRGGVKAEALPKRLLEEFSSMSQGMLSNVALATIAEIRKTTHHLIRKFNKNMDTHYLHHQALLPEPAKAKEYATALILSELKSEIDTVQIGADYLSTKNIKYWMKHRFGSKRLFALTHKDEKTKTEPLKVFKVFKGEIEEFLAVGINGFYPNRARKNFDETKKKKWKKWPTEGKIVEQSFSSAFFEKHEDYEKSMLDFSFLSSVISSELSNIHKTTMPRLDLGSIVCRDNEGTTEYFLCLQASCDTVRGDKGNFFFIPMELTHDVRPSQVVSHHSKKDVNNLVSLKVPEKAYTQSCSICFGGIDPAVGGVKTVKKQGSKYFWLKDTNDNEYRWLANIKKRRALKISQGLAKDMVRVGFDEFEPHRVK